MKLHFLGTCAGTEPMPDRKHTAFTLECNDKLYWFDAGEGCSYTAHNLGLNLLNIEKIIISHPHMDHVGGLGNLLWNIRNLHWLKKTDHMTDIDIYLPYMGVWDATITLLRCNEPNFALTPYLHPHQIQDGALFDDGNVRVTAFHNIHMAPLEGEWRSFSFLIEAQGKKIVYSGDVKRYDELDAAIGNGCDALIIETGHFGIDDVFAYTANKPIGKIFFNHSGREILNHPVDSAKRVNQLFGNKAVICFDGMTEIL